MSYPSQGSNCGIETWCWWNSAMEPFAQFHAADLLAFAPNRKMLPDISDQVPCERHPGMQALFYVPAEKDCLERETSCLFILCFWCPKGDLNPHDR